MEFNLRQMATEAIHHPVENLELLRKLAEPLGYSALKTWYGELNPNLKSRPTQAHLPPADKHPGYNVRFIGGYIRDSLSLTFVKDLEPQEKVTIRARKNYISPKKFEELDLLGTSDLAWKRGVGSSFDLIARKSRHKSSNDPSIATVESAQLLTPHDAEISLQKIALLIVDTPIDLKVA